MRRTVRLRATFLVFLTVFLAAAPALAKKKKKKVHVTPAPAAAVKKDDAGAGEARDDAPVKKSDKGAKQETKVVEVEVPDDAPDPNEPSSALPTPEVIARTGFGAHRYAYIGGAVVAATGLVLAYYAQGEAKRAQTVGSAQETRNALSNATSAAGAANVMYAAGAALVAYALLIEVLPQRLADKVSFTFHF